MEVSLFMRSTLSRAAFAGLLALAAASAAVGQELVGRMSLAIDAQVAKDIGLSDAEVAKVKEFIDGRLKEGQTETSATKLPRRSRKRRWPNLWPSRRSRAWSC